MLFCMKQGQSVSHTGLFVCHRGPNLFIPKEKSCSFYFLFFLFVFLNMVAFWEKPKEQLPRCLEDQTKGRPATEGGKEKEWKDEMGGD